MKCKSKLTLWRYKGHFKRCRFGYRYVLCRSVVISLLSTGCNNNGLADKLENPGGQNGAGISVEKFESFSTKNYIFMSSWRTPADMSFSPYRECESLTGVAKADCSCTAAAAAHNRRKDTAHKFVAVLSTDGPNGKDLRCKIQGRAGAGCSLIQDRTPWFNTQDEPIAGSLTALFDVNNVNGPKFSESGAAAHSVYAWSGTEQSGNVSQHNCTNWTSTERGKKATIAQRDSVDGRWIHVLINNSDLNTLTCDEIAPIFCASSL